MSATALHGLLYINKPAGWTSYDVVRRLKRFLPKKTKIGHFGTLDPFATGLVIIGLGDALKPDNTSFREAAKRYECIARFDSATPSGDATTLSTHCSIMPAISRDTLQKQAALWHNYTYLQHPPLYSARQVNGRRLYAYARSGKISRTEEQALIAKAAKEVSILECTIHAYAHPFIRMSLTVSHGTYIRSAITDFGRSLGYEGCTVQLHRQSIDTIVSTQAHDIRDFKNIESILSNLQNY